MPVATLGAQRAASLLTPLSTDRTAYQAVADGMRLLVADGRIPVGIRLPSERDLAVALRVSRTTVTRAYALLVDGGWAHARQGSGTVVTLPSGVIRRGTGSPLHPLDVPDHVIDLTCAAMRATPGCAMAYERAVHELPRYLAGAGYFTLGIPELRAAIAERYTVRGLPTSPEQVLVTSGAVTGLAVAASALMSRSPLGSRRMLVETPSFPNSLEVLRRNKIRCVPVPVEPDGWDTETVVSTVRGNALSAAYLIPDFHNPTGALMPDEQRSAIGSALTRAGVVPIVDETVAEIALDEPDEMPRPFAAHAPGTVTVGGASKTYWGGLRVGWVRADEELLDRMVSARVSLDPAAAVAEQLVLLELLRETPGLADERRVAIRHARDTLVAEVNKVLPEVRFQVPAGGLSLWLELPSATAAEVALAAETEGLLVAAGPRFAARGGHSRWLRLPYVLEPDVLVEAVARLRRAFDRIESGAAHPRLGRQPGPLVA